MMGDYGVPQEHKAEVQQLVASARQQGLIHCLIAWSVRGSWPHDARIDPLKQFLEAHKTHPPKNHNAAPQS